MKSPSRFRFMSVLALTSCLLASLPSLPAQEAEPKPDADVGAVREAEVPPEMIRAFLHLQEQVHATQLAVERTREEAEATAARNSAAVHNRLKALEDTLDKVRADSAAAVIASHDRVQESNTQMLMVAGCFGLVVLAAVGMLGWFQMKAVSRIAGAQTAAGFPALLGAGASSSGLSPASTLGNAHLGDVLTRLEQRIAQMEGQSHANRPLRPAFTADPVEAGDSPPPPVGTDTGSELVALMREGEVLLAREEAQKAVEHFDSILAKHPGNAEVLLRKGTALERLRRNAEAIQCYDQAIQADQNLTMAWLQKGGLFSRLERFSEAMECYEQALRVREGQRPA